MGKTSWYGISQIAGSQKNKNEWSNTSLGNEISIASLWKFDWAMSTIALYEHLVPS